MLEARAPGTRHPRVRTSALDVRQVADRAYPGLQWLRYALAPAASPTRTARHPGGRDLRRGPLPPAARRGEGRDVPGAQAPAAASSFAGDLEPVAAARDHSRPVHQLGRAAAARAPASTHDRSAPSGEG